MFLPWILSKNILKNYVRWWKFCPLKTIKSRKIESTVICPLRFFFLGSDRVQGGFFTKITFPNGFWITRKTDGGVGPKKISPVKTTKSWVEIGVRCPEIHQIGISPNATTPSIWRVIQNSRGVSFRLSSCLEFCQKTFWKNMSVEENVVRWKK